MVKFTINDKYLFFHNSILKWGSKNLRVFPWRETRNPYKILLAEIMLHRTKAKQVEEVYIKFLKKYPDFEGICNADLHKIITDLSTLGLKWRANSLYELACIISTKYNGDIPAEKKELLKLPGIGEYISSAFLCFAYDIPEPMLDTNTIRVIGRVYGLEISDSSRRNKKFKIIMQYLLKVGSCKSFSWSLIDFANAICKSRSPLCNICPLCSICNYYIKEV